MKKLRVLFYASLLLVAVGCNNNGTDTKADGVVGSDSTQVDHNSASVGGRYKAGQSLHVFAPSGLMLRATPDPNGIKVASLPRGATVEVVDTEKFSKDYSVKEPCGYEIKGYWVKVRYDKTEGYAFDGYLLTLPHPKDTDWETYWTEQSKLKSKSQEPPTDDKEITYWDYQDCRWENGVRYLSKGYEGGASSDMTIPKAMMTLQEAYVLAIGTEWEDPQNPLKVTCKPDVPEFEWSPKDEMSITRLKATPDGDWLIHSSFAD